MVLVTSSFISYKRPSRGHGLYKVKSSPFLFSTVIKIDQKSLSVRAYNCNASLCTSSSSSLPSHSHFLFPGLLLKSTIENRHQQRYCRGREWVLCRVTQQSASCSSSSSASSRFSDISSILGISLPFLNLSHDTEMLSCYAGHDAGLCILCFRAGFLVMLTA